MVEAIQELEELREFLSNLPPPKEGYYRVYRGQTGNFPAMLPSGFRPDASKTGQIWDSALLYIKQNKPDLDANLASLELMMNVGFWFKVLAQHYGPGSPYLDVTSSVEVALWFALNKAITETHELLLSQPGLESTTVICSSLHFSKHQNDNGWLYVMDVPLWDDESSSKHGQLLDLLNGPEFASKCPRVIRQKGGLVMSEESMNGGNLSSFYACSPVAVKRPFRGVSFLERDTLYLFPTPDQDEWYERLLKAPLTPQPSLDHGFEYRQSLEVYMVTDTGKQEELVPLLDRQIKRIPYLSRAQMRVYPQMRRDLRDELSEDTEDATYIQLEIPLLLTLPPAKLWNQSVLISGIKKYVQPLSIFTNELLPAISLDNVLIELSALETAFQDYGPDHAPIEAIWIVRSGMDFRVVAFGTSHESGNFSQIGPIEISFSDINQCFEVVLQGNRIPLLKSALPENLVKAFFIALEIMRGLSASLKPEPFLTLLGAGKIGLLPIRAVSTVLQRALADPEDLRIHFLRYADTLEAYHGPNLDMPYAAILELQLNGPFEEIKSLRELYGHTTKLIQRGQEIILPERESDGYCAAIGDFMLKRFPPDN